VAHAGDGTNDSHPQGVHWQGFTCAAAKHHPLRSAHLPRPNRSPAWQGLKSSSGMGITEAGKLGQPGAVRWHKLRAS
jgi:hypothetical protein